MSLIPNEGNQNGEGGSNANSTPSSPGGQPLEADFTKVIANLQKKIDAQQGEINALKSGKDKAVDRVIKSQEETLARLATYLNVDEKQVREAQRQSVLDDLVAERIGGRSLPEPTPQGRGESSSTAAELQDVDDLLDLPANDSRVTDLKLKYGNDLAAYKAEAKKLKGQITTTNPPSPAEMPLPAGLPPPRRGDKSPEQLQADMTKELTAASQTLRGDQKLRAIAAIKAKYRGEGLSVL